MSRVSADRNLAARIEEIRREMGVLVLVFAPIDTLLAPNDRVSVGRLLTFVIGAFFLLGVSLVSEYRRLANDD
jgi:hypothetical protein